MLFMLKDQSQRMVSNMDMIFNIIQQMYKSKYAKLICLLLTIIGLSLLISCKYVMADWSANLLVNTGAETDGTSGWIYTNSFYATNQQSQSLGIVYPHKGSYFFSMAKSLSEYEKAYQNVEVSLLASMIDTGNVKIKAGVWMQNEFSDSCRLTVQFLDSKDTIIGETTTGQVVHSNWNEEKLPSAVPQKTRTIRYVLEGFLHYGSWVNSFFDDAYLYISEECNSATVNNLMFCKKPEPPYEEINEIGYNEPFYIKAVYSSEPKEKMKTVILNWGESTGKPKKIIVEKLDGDSTIFISDAIYAKRPNSKDGK